MKLKLGPTDILFPIPAALIGCGSMEEPNIITVASIGMLSSTPPTIGISLDQKRYSLDLIRSSGEFSLNIPSATQYEQVDYCGIVTGKKVDKFSTASLTKMKAHHIQAPLIEECPFNMECRVTDEIQLGDYVLILAEILETHVNEGIGVMEGGKAVIDIDKLNPLVYCSTLREYREIGKKIGDGFKAGVTLLKGGE